MPDFGKIGRVSVSLPYFPHQLNSRTIRWTLYGAFSMTRYRDIYSPMKSG